MARDIDLNGQSKYRQLTNNKQFVRQRLAVAVAHLHVHVEGGLAVVLLPPARAPRGCVHAAVSGHVTRVTRGYPLCALTSISDLSFSN